MDDPGLNQLVLVKYGPATSSILLYLLDGFQDILKADAIIPHKGTASARILSRTRMRSPISVTTSTGVPKTSCRSISRPPRSERLRPGSRSTRKSTSLRESLSPRATEPNTRTLWAPCLAASSRTESRRVARKSCRVISLQFCHFSSQPGIAPAAQRTRDSDKRWNPDSKTSSTVSDQQLRGANVTGRNALQFLERRRFRIRNMDSGVACKPFDQILPCQFRLLQPDSRSLLSLEQLENFTGVFFGKPLDFPYEEFPYRGHGLCLPWHGEPFGPTMPVFSLPHLRRRQQWLSTAATWPPTAPSQRQPRPFCPGGCRTPGAAKSPRRAYCRARRRRPPRPPGGHA